MQISVTASMCYIQKKYSEIKHETTVVKWIPSHNIPHHFVILKNGMLHFSEINFFYIRVELTLITTDTHYKAPSVLQVELVQTLVNIC